MKFMPQQDDKFIKRDSSLIGRWWWTVDRYLFITVLLLIFIGILLSFSASPCIAQRIGLQRFFFVKHHLLMILPFLFLLVFASLLSPPNIKKLAILIFAGGVAALILTYFLGTEVKGAKRWLSIFGVSIQPSEFMKPALTVVTAWLLAEKQIDRNFPGVNISFILTSIFILFLILQPDVGTSIITLASFLIQLFIAGMSLFFVVGIVIAGTIGLITSYFFIPHVAQRIDSFLRPELSDHDQMYQIKQSLEAFHHGGWFGCGPGEGIVKRLVPDAHSDFVFSVAGEEYGLFMCIIIVFLFSFFVIRSIIKAYKSKNIFTIFAITGIASQLGLQAFVNMATTLRLIPTKGMTMPFISYGGSSLLAVGIAVGIILSLTKKKYGFIGERDFFEEPL
ncbi:MAG: putative lipid II flippase FtsW [Holosporales bacterium]|nr:putative lipid II flippase FtsW [Holosporales bacterium]